MDPELAGIDSGWIVQARHQLGLTQEDLARIIGVTVSTVNRWENGHAKPSMLARVALRAWAKAGGILALVLWLCTSVQAQTTTTTVPEIRLDWPPPIATAIPQGWCGCWGDDECFGRKCVNGRCWENVTTPGVPTCMRDTDCPSLACLCLDAEHCSILVTITEPQEPPLAPIDFVATPTGCSTVHFTWDSDWPYPTATRLYQYVNDQWVMVGEHEHPDGPLHEADGTVVPARSIGTYAVSSVSTQYGIEGAMSLPAVADLVQACPLAGDCAMPYDDEMSVFDVLHAVDATLGRVDPGKGCDVDCNQAVDVFDVLAAVDIVLTRRPMPNAPCALTEA